MAYESQRTAGVSSRTPVATPPVDTANSSARMPDVPDGPRRGLFRTRHMLYGLCIILLGIGVPYGWQL
jgi:hypothetical protein